MGMPGPLELGIILAIVVVIFGGKKIAALGCDIGDAIRGFRGAVKDIKEVEGDIRKDL